MRALVKAAVAVLVIAGAATSFQARADQDQVFIPGTTVVASTPVQWRSGAFYGLKQCHNDDYNDHVLGSEDGVRHDASVCFTVRATDSRVVLLFPDTANAQGREVVTNVKD